MKKIIILLLILMLLLFSGCEKREIYPDTNGSDNYELQTITTDKLFKTNSFIVIGFVSTRTQKDEIIKVHQSAFELNGVRKVEEFEKGKYDIKVDFKVNSGNTKLVLTDGGNIIYEFNPNEGIINYSFENNSKYFLKIAGESLDYQLDIEITKQ